MSEEILALNPPAVLEAPKPVPVVTAHKADGMVKLEPDELADLDTKVDEFVGLVVRSEVNSDEFEDRVMAIHNMGTREIRASSQISNRMLDKPVETMQNGLFDDGSTISKSLTELRRTVEELDPAGQGDLLSTRRILGVIPFGNKVRNYFMKYQSSQTHINGIINTLYRGQDELRKDNASIEQEKLNMWKLMKQMQKYVYVGNKIDTALQVKVDELEVTDPEKARVVKEEVLFYVRQKVQDLLTQLAVNIQGYLALDMIRKNNLELIKGVDRATTTTVSALRTAVMVAQALANQKLVLDQISALNTTTGNLIESTSVLLKQQTGQIHEQAAGATIGLEKLQAAFNNIYDTMDMIANYKIEALSTMQQTVGALSTEVAKAQTYLDRVRRDEIADVTEDWELLESPDEEIKL